MTRRAKDATAAAVAGLLLAIRTWYFWPFSFVDRSIVTSDRYVAIGGAVVENGSAFDQAALDLSPYKVVVLPDDADVQEGPPGQRLQVFLRKTLAFGGHPPERMSIRGARKNMGCAVRAEGEMLTVAPFGEWGSHIEGGAYMR